MDKRRDQIKRSLERWNKRREDLALGMVDSAFAFMCADVSSEIKWCLTPSCSAECGVQGVDVPATPGGDHPWHVGVYSKSGTAYSLICSGSIISPVLVISVAISCNQLCERVEHVGPPGRAEKSRADPTVSLEPADCFWSETEKLLPASVFAIAAGKLYRDWDDPRDNDAQKRNISEIRIHPSYEGKKGDYRYDIAIVFFTTAFVYNKEVRPVCIDYDQDLERSQLHTGSGEILTWSEKVNGTSKPVDVAYLKYVDGTQCLFNVPRSFVRYLTTDKFCAENERGSKLCKDDKGGGLVFEEGYKGLFLKPRYYLRGLVSTSPPSDAECSTFPATTFGWIYAYRDFIQEQLTAIGKQLFQCGDGNVIPANNLCDGVVNCADGSDETSSACAGTVCPKELFKCAYGGCLNAAFCDGKQECIDGSDEDKATCDRQGDDTSYNVTQSTVCRLPPFPKHGSYKVINEPDAKPGNILDNFYLEYQCDDEYKLVGNPSLYCYKNYQPKQMTSCIKMCRLDPHPSVEYQCHVPGSNGGMRPCELYEPGGTVVTPDCRAPNYYSAQFLRNMKCTNGAWDYVATCLAVCGATTPKGEILVVGGRPSEKGEVPWHVAIYNKRKTPYEQICAAHCFWHNSNHKLSPPSDFAVAAGKIYRAWDDERDTDVQRSDVADIKIPDRFLGVQTNFEDDLALLVLSRSLMYAVHIRPVCLELGILFDRKQLAVGNLGKVAGWGLIDEQGTSPQKLQVVDLPFIDIKKCLNDAPRSFREYITGDKICAGYNDGTAALCKGDSGGGLAFPEIFGGEKRFYLRGVVSTAPPNKMDCNSHAVTTFTHLLRHEYFIKQNYFGQ
ncbi:Modular serine protease [Eumeta japonica]|uniref:Modular serine protease n=1 Tax=Eumeta variegata TaxID=151549 RepID=A0A4C1V3W7_EUMVA|nr:Modular serine protease [Eumeta japonica]